jgi:hypothetical protein
VIFLRFNHPTAQRCAHGLGGSAVQGRFTSHAANSVRPKKSPRH